MPDKKQHILIAAGGTGGHLFPALAVVNELKSRNSDFTFTFTGRTDKIEGRIIPESEHNFLPVNVRGFSKKINFELVKLPFRFFSAYRKIKKYIKANDVKAVICAGAYISYSPGLAAAHMKLPLFLLEANVNPGKAIKTLSNKATYIFTSFEESNSYFKDCVSERLIYTGNPVRSELLNLPPKDKSLHKLGLKQDKKTILIFGGSLGAKSINEATLRLIDALDKNIQIIWQTGKNFEIIHNLPDNVSRHRFIDDMASAYAAADLVIARSGATTVAELEVAGKPSILIPLPSASNNEQYHNAKALEDNNACIIINDNNIESELIEKTKNLINNDNLLAEMSLNAKTMSKPNAAAIAADFIIKKLS